MVTGSGTTNGSGNLGVTLAGSAAFTSATSYVCTASYAKSQAGSSAPTVTMTNGTSFTVKGDSSSALQYVCVGN
jgi:hypothetical protein